MVLPNTKDPCESLGWTSIDRLDKAERADLTEQIGLSRFCTEALAMTGWAKGHGHRPLFPTV